jgi:hypothetical protein
VATATGDERIHVRLALLGVDVAVAEAGLPRSLTTGIVWSRRRFVKGVSTARSGA